MLAPSKLTVPTATPAAAPEYVQTNPTARTIEGAPRVLTTSQDTRLLATTEGSTHIPKTAVGAIIGGTLAGFVLVLLAFFAWRRARKRKASRGDVERDRLTEMVGTPDSSSDRERERERKSNGSSPRSLGNDSDVGLQRPRPVQDDLSKKNERVAGAGNVRLRTETENEVDAGKEELTRSGNPSNSMPWGGGFQHLPSPPLTPPLPIPTPSRPKPLKSALKPSLPAPPPPAKTPPSSTSTSTSKKPQPRRKKSTTLHTVPEENKHDEEKRAREAEEKHQSLIMAALSQRWSVLTRSSTSTGGGRHRMSRVSQASSAATGYSQHSGGAIPVGLAYGGD